MSRLLILTKQSILTRCGLFCHSKQHNQINSGKTCEQVRNWVNVRLIADPTKMMKAVAKVCFRRSEIVNDDLAMVHAICQDENNP